ncbi:MAG: TlpA family protein disulfide reductase [Deltaproteobacteria bacterium]|nr:TlpA family protein disulfide reductase [Deltaproteobacteria bacterium]MBI3075742.1 TlpA family protein disulfide reductase [Deltaproteobacteria bacterium]
MPFIDQLYRTYAPRGFVVLAVAMDREGARAVEPAVRERGYSFPVLLDPKMEVANRYGVHATPTVVLIDRQGRAVGQAVGERNWGGPPGRALLEALLMAPARKAAGQS